MSNPQLSSFDTNMLNAIRGEIHHLERRMVVLREDSNDRPKELRNYPIVLEYLELRVLEIESHGRTRMF
jgi:hypothetical protein|tara:strand:+ start:215 stop:421 length:207 start_codon:yes stop_codon:yes gene_type:complete